MKRIVAVLLLAVLTLSVVASAQDVNPVHPNQFPTNPLNPHYRERPPSYFVLFAVLLDANGGDWLRTEHTSFGFEDLELWNVLLSEDQSFAVWEQINAYGPITHWTQIENIEFVSLSSGDVSKVFDRQLGFFMFLMYDFNGPFPEKWRDVNYALGTAGVQDPYLDGYLLYERQ